VSQCCEKNKSKKSTCISEFKCFLGAISLVLGIVFFLNAIIKSNIGMGVFCLACLFFTLILIDSKEISKFSWLGFFSISWFEEKKKDIIKIENDIKKLLLDSYALRWMNDHRVVILRNYGIKSISDEGVENLPSVWRLYCLMNYCLNIVKQRNHAENHRLHNLFFTPDFKNILLNNKHDYEVLEKKLTDFFETKKVGFLIIPANLHYFCYFFVTKKHKDNHEFEKMKNIYDDTEQDYIDLDLFAKIFSDNEGKVI
jgi:hypothetical protein